MPGSISDEAIERGTSRTWSEWMNWFESASAADKSHTEIARQINEETDDGGWWAQMLTVAFEQEIGRRVPGQDCEGEFSVSTSKTLNLSLDQALEWWLKAVDDHNSFCEVAVSGAPEVSRTDKWRYWRARLADGSRINIHIYEKAPGKSTLTVMHEKLESTDQIEYWRACWKAFLKQASAAG